MLDENKKFTSEQFQPSFIGKTVSIQVFTRTGYTMRAVDPASLHKHVGVLQMYVVTPQVTKFRLVGGDVIETHPTKNYMELFVAVP